VVYGLTGAGHRLLPLIDALGAWFDTLEPPAADEVAA
jgi:DNA-binding HxlR family transcriptional regulator